MMFLQQTLLALLNGLPLTINPALLSLFGGGVLALLLHLLRMTRAGSALCRFY
ncbi:MAG TPA: ABC transporter permease, partial [Pantoea agglomerans]|nr:ABC transporter permease [Pantoea agglomerans]